MANRVHPGEWLIAGRPKIAIEHGEMGFKSYFREELRRCYAPQTALELCADIEARYQAIYPDISFAHSSSNPMDRRLEFCAYFLATIQVLQRRGETFEQIRTLCLTVTESYVRPRNAWQRWLKKLPVKFMGTWFMRTIVRRLASKIGTKGHPDGFLVQVVTAPAETNGLGYGFDIVECGVCTLFRKHGASEYVPILCEVDKLTSSLAGLELVRGGTLATGFPRCDFRFKLLPPPK